MKNFRRFVCLIIMVIVFTGNTYAFQELDLIGTNSIAVDYNTNEIIYADSIDDTIQIASITKLMTALLFAENMERSDELSYTESAYAQPPYAYRTQVHPVKIGDKVKAEDAMDMLLIYSANDIAYMIGDNVAGNIDLFIDMMYDKAKELGMNNTKFVTLNGLDDQETKPYSTAYDVALLCKAAFENQWIRESLAKAEASVRFINGASAIVETRNKLLGIDGNIAGKTGYTTLAGRCLVSLYEREGRKIIGVVMNSKYDLPRDTQVFEDMEKLINYSYAAKKTILHKKGEEVDTIKVKYPAISFLNLIRREIEVPVVLKEDIAYYDVNLDMKEEISLEKSKDIDVWDIDKDTVLGKIIIYQGKEKKEYDLTTTLNKKDLIFKNIHIYIISFIILLFLLVLILNVIKRIKIKSKKNRKFY